MRCWPEPASAGWRLWGGGSLGCCCAPCRGEGEGLEQLVRSFLWLRGMGLLRCPIVIADAGLTPAGWELALRLSARWPEVALWPASDLGDYITGT